ncbi:Hypothetical predicted protein [Argonauta hians]
MEDQKTEEDLGIYGERWDSIDIKSYTPVIDWKMVNGQKSYLDRLDVNSYRSGIEWDEAVQGINMDHLDIRQSQVLIIQMAEKAPLKPKRHIPRMYNSTDNVFFNGRSDTQGEHVAHLEICLDPPFFLYVLRVNRGIIIFYDLMNPLAYGASEVTNSSAIFAL